MDTVQLVDNFRKARCILELFISTCTDELPGTLVLSG